MTVNKNKPLVGGPIAGRKDGAVAAGATLQVCQLAEIAGIGADAEQETFQTHSTDGGYAGHHVRKRMWDGGREPGGVDAIDATIPAGDYVEVTELKVNSRILGRLGENAETVGGETRLVSDGAGGVRPLGADESKAGKYYLARESLSTGAGESALVICEVLEE